MKTFDTLLSPSSSEKNARQCSAQQFRLISRLECGGDVSSCQNKGSLLVNQSSFGLSWRSCLRSTGFCWTAFTRQRLAISMVLVDFLRCNSCQFLPSQCPTTVGPPVRHGPRHCCVAVFLRSARFPDQITASGMAVASLPLRLGGLGIRSVVGAQSAAHWASWADALAMMHARHLAVAHTIVRVLDGEGQFRGASWEALGKFFTIFVRLKRKSALACCHCDTHRGGMYHCLLLNIVFCFPLGCVFFWVWRGGYKSFFLGYKRPKGFFWDTKVFFRDAKFLFLTFSEVRGFCQL